MNLRSEILNASAISGKSAEPRLNELELLSKTAVGDGLLVPFSAAFLREVLNLKHSFLALCYDSDNLIGYALFQTSLTDPPKWVKPISEKLKGIPNIGYANLIVVKRQYRGASGGYDSILKTALESKEARGITFITLARPDNPRAMAAHKKRGWIGLDYTATILLGEKECDFTLLGIGSNTEAIKQRLNSQR